MLSSGPRRRGPYGCNLNRIVSQCLVGGADRRARTRGARRLDGCPSHFRKRIGPGHQAFRSGATGWTYRRDTWRGWLSGRHAAAGSIFPIWRFRYKIPKVPTIIVPAGEIALVVAADGAPIPKERVLAKAVPCFDFQDASAFIEGGGRRGRQIAFLTAGTATTSNPALFEVVTAQQASRYAIHASAAARAQHSDGVRWHRHDARRR